MSGELTDSTASGELTDSTVRPSEQGAPREAGPPQDPREVLPAGGRGRAQAYLPECAREVVHHEGDAQEELESAHGCRAQVEIVLYLAAEYSV